MAPDKLCSDVLGQVLSCVLPVEKELLSTQNTVKNKYLNTAEEKSVGRGLQESKTNICSNSYQSCLH